MNSFKFVVLNSSGEKKIGTVRARSLSDAKRKIQKKRVLFKLDKNLRIEDSSGYYGQRYSSFFKELKDFFFSKQKIKL